MRLESLGRIHSTGLELAVNSVLLTLFFQRSSVMKSLRHALLNSRIRFRFLMVVAVLGALATLHALVHRHRAVADNHCGE